jgi:hypothetical protein
MPSTPTVASSGTQTATVGSTPDVLYTTTTAGTYILSVDCSALADDELLILRIRRKILTAGTVRTAYVWTVVGTLPVDDAIQVSVPITCGFGADFTLNQTNGTGRAFPFEIVQP